MSFTFIDERNKFLTKLIHEILYIRPLLRKVLRNADNHIEEHAH